MPRSTNGKTEQIKAIKVNALLSESGKRSSIPARVPGRRDWPRYRSKRGAASERPYRKLSVERFEPAEQLVRRGREVADARAGYAVDGVDNPPRLRCRGQQRLGYTESRALGPTCAPCPLESQPRSDTWPSQSSPLTKR
jgi:hypothetical protein